MHLETTVELLKRKFETLAGSRPARSDPFDLDRLLVRAPLFFNDRYLDAPPSARSVSALVEAGCPAWALVSRGVVNRVAALLSARQNQGLASIPAARSLAAAGHPCPWSVLDLDVAEELDRLREKAPVGDEPTEAQQYAKKPIQNENNRSNNNNIRF
jgi:hypothetical protein